MRNYTHILLVVASFFCASMIGFNWLIDPYNIWGGSRIAGINLTKPQQELNERIYKLVGLINKPASTVILGTSRSDFGLNPNHEVFWGAALNLAIADQPYIESRQILDLLAKRKSVRTAIIGLDFVRANANKSNPPDFDLQNFSQQRSFQLLTSISTFKDSVLTIIANGKNTTASSWTERGLHLWPAAVQVDSDSYKRAFSETERTYLFRHYLPLPTCTFSFDSIEGVGPLEQIRKLIAQAHHDNIKLKLFVSPSHAMQWETIAAAGLWDKWEAWKVRLVTINEEEAALAGRESFPLWDFSGYNSITTENIPNGSEGPKRMNWYFESSHYTPATGDLVIDRLFEYKSSDRVVPNDFGVLLTSKNINKHLKNIRAARINYKNTHIQEILDIESLAKNVAKSKRCQPFLKDLN